MQLTQVSVYRYEPLTPFEHVEHGKNADISFKDLLTPGSQVTDLTPSIGAEVTGVQLSQLNTLGKDQLARFVAEKKVVGMPYGPLKSYLTHAHHV